MHRLETSHNLQQPVPVSVLATGHDVTTCSRLCFSPAGRLGAVAVTLEKSIKNRDQAAFPDTWGVPHIPSASKSH